jgi:hypothetical protein
MQRTDLLIGVKRVYAASAQAVGRGLIRVGVRDNGPPVRDRRLAHWVYSLSRIHDSPEMVKLDVPWWTYGAIDEVEKWLSNRSRPARVFEYGSGASTVWLSRRADEVHSVEHDRGFAELMAPVMATRPNIDLVVVEPEAKQHIDVASSKEGYRGLDFSAYVAAIDRVEGPFDLVVVDGRAREACLAAAIRRLNPEGVVVFDNSARRRYRPAICKSGLPERRFRGLVPTLPYPDQTSVLGLTGTSRAEPEVS